MYIIVSDKIIQEKKSKAVSGPVHQFYNCKTSCKGNSVKYLMKISTIPEQVQNMIQF